MKKLSFKIRAFKRKNDIDCIKTEKESLKQVILDALNHRGSLNRVQRSQVLCAIVDEWKAQEQANETESKKAFLEAEEPNDIAKGINLFDVIKIN